jgi:hypothetical protein
MGDGFVSASKHQSFFVDERGQFVELSNIDDLVQTVERLTLDASADPEAEENAEERQQRESFVKQYVEQSRSQTKQAVTNEVRIFLVPDRVIANHSF